MYLHYADKRHTPHDLPEPPHYGLNHAIVIKLSTHIHTHTQLTSCFLVFSPQAGVTRKKSSQSSRSSLSEPQSSSEKKRSTIDIGSDFFSLFGANEETPSVSTPAKPPSDAVTAPIKAVAQVQASKKVSKSPAKSKPRQSKDSTAKGSPKSSPEAADGSARRSQSNGTTNGDADGQTNLDGASAAVDDAGTPASSRHSESVSSAHSSEHNALQLSSSDDTAKGGAGARHDSSGDDTTETSAYVAGAVSTVSDDAMASGVDDRSNAVDKTSSPSASAVGDAAAGGGDRHSPGRLAGDGDGDGGGQPPGNASDANADAHGVDSTDGPVLPQGPAVVVTAAEDTRGPTAEEGVTSTDGSAEVNGDQTAMRSPNAPPVVSPVPEVSKSPSAASPIPAGPTKEEISGLDDVAASYARKLAHVSMVLAAREEKLLQLMKELDGKNETHAVRVTIAATLHA